MDEMNNKNELNWQQTTSTAEAPVNAEATSAPSAEAPKADANSFANNDNPNGNNTYYNYQPGVNGVGGAQAQTSAPLDNAAALEKAKKSMIFGIISAALLMVCGCFPASVILGVIAIINATKAKKLSVTGTMPGMAIAGLACGIYGLAMGALSMIVVAIYVVLVVLGFATFTMEAFSNEVYLALCSLM